MMTHRVRLALASLLSLSSIASIAQGLRLPATPPISPAPAPAAAVGQRSADYIVAVVNSEPITNHQVRQEVQSAVRQFAQRQQPLPDARLLADQALERLINDRAQLQLARSSGIKVDDAAVDDAELAVARQNQVDLAELLRRMAAEGADRNQFRKQLRDQLMVIRLRERDVGQRVKISELDIDQYLLEQQKNPDQALSEIHIAHVLAALPDDPSAAQVTAAQAKAQKVLESARGGEDFAKLAREQSDAQDAAVGGQLGLRTVDRYPALFVDAVRSLPVGGLSIVRSGAGFHVLKLLDKRSAGLPASAVVQTRASHILLRTSPELNEAAARARLGEFRRRILAGLADFATLARENSQDGSAAQGGDLGWASPGQFVPEFEEALSALTPGAVSEPLTSRFGVHLVQVRERRTVQLSQREQREAVRAILREKKLDETFVTWAQDLRARAYVEMREPPG